jgi:hydroxymethylglutaryl-CoA lyase
MNGKAAALQVELVEVGPRDGLQNEALGVATADKVHLIKQLVAAGLRRIETVSFVHPQKVPQMADAAAVMAALPYPDGVTYIGLVLNEKGAIRALQTNVHELGAVVSASDGFGLRNQNQTVAQSVETALRIMRLARQDGRVAQATIAVSFGCPIEGLVPPTRVIEIAEQLMAGEPREICVADTIGVAVPAQVDDLVRRLRERVNPLPVRVHFHNTRNTAIANVWTAINAGVRTIDSSVGGIGGCPFAPRATGNVATEDVVYLLNHSGIGSGVDIEALIRTAAWCSNLLNHPVPGMVARAGDFHPTGPRRTVS